MNRRLEHIQASVLIPSLFYMKKILSFSFLLLAVYHLQGQNGCPDCIITLPEDLVEDTIFLTDAPSGQANVYYDRDLSFRLPKSTTPVASLDSTTPPNLPISSLEIVSVTNLPPGLSWEANMREFDTSEETDGCVKICGTPLIPGLYMVEVILDAQVVILSQRTSFSFPLLIQPSVSATDGFRMINNVGCGEVDVTFINTILSNEVEGFSYRWDFGNGLVSEAENPAPLTYDEPGIYEVTYEAVIDTTGFILTKAVIENTTCNDILGGRPDLKIDVLDPDGTSIYTSDVINNAQLPLTFELVLPIEDIGNYSLRVTDEDSGIGGADDVCGVVNFTQMTTGTLTDGEDLSINLTIINPTETIQSKDTVFVYAQPDIPIVERMDAFPLCEGDTVRLQVTNFQEGLQWVRDSTTLFEEMATTLNITENGSYWARYTSPAGCNSVSMVEEASFGVIPSGIAYAVENNTLSVFDPAGLPENSTVAWEVDGEPILGANGFSYCIDSTATYTLIVTDNTTGCFATFSQTITYDPNFPNCVSNTKFVDEDLISSVYPNPFRDEITIELSSTAAIPSDFRLISIDGREVIRKKWRDLPGNWNKKELALYELAKGIYILQLFSGQLHQNVKLIKE